MKFLYKDLKIILNAYFLLFINCSNGNLFSSKSVSTTSIECTISEGNQNFKLIKNANGTYVINYNDKNEKIVGNANRKQDLKSLAHFNGINLEGIGNLYIRKGKKPSIKIIAEENIIEFIKAENYNGQLHIYIKVPQNKTIVTKGINYYLELPELKNIKKISSNGITNVYVDEILNNDLDLKLEAYGSSSIEFNKIEVQNLSLQTYGTSKIFSKNITSKFIKIETSGSSQIDIDSLNSKKMNMELNGTTEILIDRGSCDEGSIILNGSSRFKRNNFKLKNIERYSLNGTSQSNLGLDI
ncbi:MAG: hypothetical protein GY830_10940 [Bacteroidetes bacterium]|nr:hypothetical protein [Bacteroidota bacterium]